MAQPHTLSKPVSRATVWIRRCLIAIVLIYVGVLILAPIAARWCGARFKMDWAPSWKR